MKTQLELAQALQVFRKKKGLGQKDMRMLIGMSQQQYQRAESGGDIRLSSLFRILEGLDLELHLVSRDQAVEEGAQSEEMKQEQPSAWSSVMQDLED